MSDWRRMTQGRYWCAGGLKMLLAVVVGVVFFILVLYLRQEKMIFFPQPVSEQALARISRGRKSVEDIHIRTADGIMLRGWLVKSGGLAKSPLIIYFGGNAEEVSWLISESARLRGWSLALINYRGYGLSGGSPGEKELFSDALVVHDYFAGRRDIHREDIVLMGRSLGSGVAVYLAHNRPVKGLVLITPFDSMLRVAQAHFRFLPVSLLLRHRFDSFSLAPSIRQPMLALAAERDTIIPPHHAKRLVDHWGGPATFVVVEAADHNSVDAGEGFWQSIRDFLSRLQPDASSRYVGTTGH